VQDISIDDDGSPRKRILDNQAVEIEWLRTQMEAESSRAESLFVRSNSVQETLDATREEFMKTLQETRAEADECRTRLEGNLATLRAELERANRRIEGLTADVEHNDVVHARELQRVRSEYDAEISELSSKIDELNMEHGSQVPFCSSHSQVLVLPFHRHSNHSCFRQRVTFSVQSKLNPYV